MKFHLYPSFHSYLFCNGLRHILQKGKRNSWFEKHKFEIDTIERKNKVTFQLTHIQIHESSYKQNGGNQCLVNIRKMMLALYYRHNLYLCVRRMYCRRRVQFGKLSEQILLLYYVCS